MPILTSHPQPLPPPPSHSLDVDPQLLNVTLHPHAPYQATTQSEAQVPFPQKIKLEPLTDELCQRAIIAHSIFFATPQTASQAQQRSYSLHRLFLEEHNSPTKKLGVVVLRWNFEEYPFLRKYVHSSPGAAGNKWDSVREFGGFVGGLWRRSGIVQPSQPVCCLFGVIELRQNIVAQAALKAAAMQSMPQPSPTAPVPASSYIEPLQQRAESLHQSIVETIEQQRRTAIVHQQAQLARVQEAQQREVQLQLLRQQQQQQRERTELLRQQQALALRRPSTQSQPHPHAHAPYYSSPIVHRHNASRQSQSFIPPNHPQYQYYLEQYKQQERAYHYGIALPPHPHDQMQTQNQECPESIYTLVPYPSPATLLWVDQQRRIVASGGYSPRPDHRRRSAAGGSQVREGEDSPQSGAHPAVEGSFGVSGSQTQDTLRQRVSTG
ncbi:hypothetical protein SISNIDRAFT_486211 [Sistotremastrum niveocremeum HHB9708]|uniref:Uncharacterized protein n=1 Tax=Sistotremastrum niveocremeum HHB9708 TaxID=1314777 RepID=A0A164TWB2_9AGAM|nr:hypothetical protein SISNIDRAFT_486211 [Sistotremastrum niveocremeum HHB9708]